MSERPPLLVFADDWGRHPSSCQHLIKRLREDFPVVWVNTIGTRSLRADSFTLTRGIEKIRSWKNGMRQVDRQMWTIDLPMVPSLGGFTFTAINRLILNRYLKSSLRRLGLQRPTILTTLPHVWPLIRNLPRQKLIYYCTDDYSHWPDADAERITGYESSLAENADLILAVSLAIRSRLNSGDKCRYFPHAVDVEHFASTTEMAPMPEMQNFPAPRLGFFGLIYEKLDFALLSRLSESFRHGSLIMIGREDHCPAAFRSLPNVHLLGPKSFQELPRWLAAFDVLLMPYVDDPMIRQSNPLKLRECLATGKPVVCVDIPEAVNFEPHVRIGRSQQDFVTQVDLALTSRETPETICNRRNVVKADTWETRADELRELIRIHDQKRSC